MSKKRDLMTDGKKHWSQTECGQCIETAQTIYHLEKRIALLERECKAARSIHAMWARDWVVLDEQHKAYADARASVGELPTK